MSKFFNSAKVAITDVVTIKLLHDTTQFNGTNPNGGHGIALVETITSTPIMARRMAAEIIRLLDAHEAEVKAKQGKPN